MQKPNKDSAPLRDGAVDLETGVVAPTNAPELRTQALFRDGFVGVVRKGHPLSQGKITIARYASAGHICVSRLGLETGTSEEERLLDQALHQLGYERRVITLVGGFSTAVALAGTTDLIASVPERHTGALRAGMYTFPLPFSTPYFTVSMLWHPRLDADPAQRVFRRPFVPP